MRHEGSDHSLETRCLRALRGSQQKGLTLAKKKERRDGGEGISHGWVIHRDHVPLSERLFGGDPFSRNCGWPCQADPGIWKLAFHGQHGLHSGF
ncbi:hypothetical protein BC937DRAFT_92265 [Endogone sp. FLAS-F59071]|nr:hypothetical protein BC937DRAFT_92265 [Endogone sp. FLAS-F59071]|eukprot:RUS15580.1 hypothetical protein BC937DRAFT_92265 [Endogone sp. FLAS-F59071]